MAKELPYFKFRPAEYTAGNILLCSFEAQGLFINLCTIYWSELGKLPLRRAKKRFPLASENAWNELIEEECMKVDGDAIRITFLDKQLEERGQKAIVNRKNIAKRWIDKNGDLKPKTKKKYEVDTNGIPESYNREREGEREGEQEILDSSSVLDNSPVSGGLSFADAKAPRNIEERIEKFREDAYLEGGTTYTSVMIEDFISYWIEPSTNRKVPKLRFELEKTWEFKRRFSTWARRSREYPCYLTDSERTIEVKKQEFVESLKPHLEKYGRTTLNEFYGYWTQPENKAAPKFMRYELEEFWDVGQRLASWKSRDHSGQEISQKTTGYSMPRSFIETGQKNT